MLGRNVGKGLRFHPVATASQLPLTPRVNETTVNDGDLPMFRLLVETLADPRSAIFVLRNPYKLKIKKRESAAFLTLSDQLCSEST